ncbi:hypothetical protein CsSME_00002987 [Camellia sinensis var. sinensis]
MLGVTHTEEHRGGEIAANLGKWAKWAKDMKPRDNCFLCDELHWARDCPKRRSLIAKLEEARKNLQGRRDEGVAALGGGECHRQRNPDAALTRKCWKPKEITGTL